MQCHGEMIPERQRQKRHREVELSGLQTSTSLLACNMHHGWIFFPSIPRACLHFSLSTHIGSNYHYAVHKNAASETRTRIQQVDELNVMKWSLLYLGLWSHISISRLPCSPQEVGTLPFCPARRLERFLREWTAAEAPPRGQHPQPVESFAAFLYAFLINPKLLTKVCNYFLHLEL